MQDQIIHNYLIYIYIYIIYGNINYKVIQKYIYFFCNCYCQQYVKDFKVYGNVYTAIKLFASPAFYICLAVIIKNVYIFGRLNCACLAWTYNIIIIIKT